MNHYEVTFIIDPVLSGDEIKSTASTYETLLKDQGCAIVHVNAMGLKQLAYPINKNHPVSIIASNLLLLQRTAIGKTELSLRRDEESCVSLPSNCDKYGVKYNEDRRAECNQCLQEKESKKKPFDGPVATLR
ncbi:MAG: 30S ribosomal protein S6 [Saprospiraceae bacterium]|nr:30S ribosomal protein S6 [Saprospiraceae bacterium]